MNPDCTRLPALFGIVLAAGGSSRLGHAKQLVRFGGASLLARSVRHITAVCGAGTAVVLGADAGVMRAEVDERVARVIEHPGWEEGLGTSLERGVAAAPPGCQGVLITLCDQPLVTTAGLRELATAWTQDKTRIVAAFYDDTPGVPAIFPARYLGALAGVTGNTGARAMLRDRLDELILVPMPDAALDVDTADDVAALRRLDGPGPTT